MEKGTVVLENASVSMNISQHMQTHTVSFEAKFCLTQCCGMVETVKVNKDQSLLRSTLVLKLQNSSQCLIEKRVESHNCSSWWLSGFYMSVRARYIGSLKEIVAGLVLHSFSKLISINSAQIVFDRSSTVSLLYIRRHGFQPFFFVTYTRDSQARCS